MRSGTAFSQFLRSFIPTLVCCLAIRGSTGGFLLLRYSRGVVSHPKVLQMSQYVYVESSSLTHHRPYS